MAKAVQVHGGGGFPLQSLLWALHEEVEVMAQPSSRCFTSAAREERVYRSDGTAILTMLQERSS